MGARIFNNLPELIRLYDSGVSLRQLAFKFHIAPTILAREFRKAGVVLRHEVKRDKLRSLDLSVLIKLYEQGVSIHQIAKQLCVATSTVKRMFRNIRVSLRGHDESMFVWRRRTQRVCEQCGRMYLASPSEIKKGRRFCSVLCSRVGQHRPLSRRFVRCSQCGQVVSCKASEKNRSFCSVSCADQSKRTGRILTCNECGQMKYVPNHQLRDPFYCSLKCFHRSHTGIRSGLVRQCGECGSEIYAMPSKFLTRHYCSLNCSTRALRRARSQQRFRTQVRLLRRILTEELEKSKCPS
jgi:hypothetical protein